jgi:hypothetical protein
MSASGHPQFGAIVEKSNRGTVDILQKYTEEHKKNWDLYIPFLMLALNISVHSTTKEVLFFIHHGTDANLLLQTIFRNPLPNPQANTDTYLHTITAQLQLAFRSVHKNTDRAIQDQIARLDPQARPVIYDKGDLVWFRPPCKRTKLDPFWFGPYIIVDKISDSTY